MARWCAVGQTHEELGKFDDAIKCYQRAVRCDDPEGVSLMKLASLHERLADVARGELRDADAHERHYNLAANCLPSVALTDTLKTSPLAATTETVVSKVKLTSFPSCSKEANLDSNSLNI